MAQMAKDESKLSRAEAFVLREDAAKALAGIRYHNFEAKLAGLFLDGEHAKLESQAQEWLSQRDERLRQRGGQGKAGITEQRQDQDRKEEAQPAQRRPSAIGQSLGQGTQDHDDTDDEDLSFDDAGGAADKKACAYCDDGQDDYKAVVVSNRFPFELWDVHGHDTVRQVKRRISQRFGYPLQQQSFWLGCSRSESDDAQTLAALGSPRVIAIRIRVRVRLAVRLGPALLAEPGGSLALRLAQTAQRAQMANDGADGRGPGPERKQAEHGSGGNAGNGGGGVSGPREEAPLQWWLMSDESPYKGLGPLFKKKVIPESLVCVLDARNESAQAASERLRRDLRGSDVAVPAHKVLAGSAAWRPVDLAAPLFDERNCWVEEALPTKPQGQGKDEDEDEEQVGDANNQRGKPASKREGRRQLGNVHSVTLHVLLLRDPRRLYHRHSQLGNPHVLFKVKYFAVGNDGHADEVHVRHDTTLRQLCQRRAAMCQDNRRLPRECRLTYHYDDAPEERMLYRDTLAHRLIGPYAEVYERTPCYMSKIIQEGLKARR